MEPENREELETLLEETIESIKEKAAQLDDSKLDRLILLLTEVVEDDFV